ncbi:four-carbon acid sugar kinase family protein [Neobacillus niacini]|uniref:four-carbon acid sugar kinase family protein n=1 Tax=Neobacillus niacini TaxID=86668 RepID=UPI0030003A3C
MENLIGVVADDTTGANDIGVMFSKSQSTVKVVNFEENSELKKDANVVIIDTDSRLDSLELSYQKVFQATKMLEKLGCTIYFNKTCSVFRGNIGTEFDAMLDALEEDFAVISLAFPKNGRKTINGVHTVHGKLLEDSEFANDPVHPMTQSNLVSILQAQTKRKVVNIDISIVRQGAEVLRNKIEELRQTYNYCIIDSETQADLGIVAKACTGIKVLAGSSAIAEEIPKYIKLDPIDNPKNNLDIKDSNGVLVVSGSLTPQTKRQTEYLINLGIATIIVDSRTVFNEEEKEKEVARVYNDALNYIKLGKDVLIMADNNKEVVRQTKEIGLNKNIDDLTISKTVSAVLAVITEMVVTETGLQRLVVAGGDTSGTVMRQLGITGNYVLEEIETGVPSGLAIGRNLLIVLKSGSFGSPEFLKRAIDHLNMISIPSL